MACYILETQLFTELSTVIVERIFKNFELFKSQLFILFFYRFFTK